MANRFYNNSTHTIVDFTRADAADVENKCDDVADGFDALQIELDAEVAARGTGDTALSDRLEAEALRVVSGVETPDLLISDNAAARANKVVSFDEFGDIILRTVAVDAELVQTYTIVTGAETLAVNSAYYVQAGGFTLLLPPGPVAGEPIHFAFDDGAEASNVTIDGNGKNIAGDTTLIVDCDNAQFVLVYDGTEWNL